MNLRQLEHLVALADEGSFARAAEAVHLSQPALTRSIQTLEDSLALALFDRHPRGVTITPGGKVVLERARRVLFEAGALDRDVTLFKDNELGDVGFGVGPYPAAILLPDVIAALAAAHPRLAMRAEVNNWGALLQALKAETIDFFVVDKRGVPLAPELQIQLLETHRCGWFARASHPLFERKPRLHAMLRELPLASVPLPPSLHEEFRKALRFKAGDTLNFTVQCNSFYSLKQLAERSDLVIYGPLAGMRQELASGVLRRIDFDDSRGFDMQFAIIHLANRTVSANARRAMDALAECDRRLHLEG